ncbi:MAG: CapA family protein [Patescibacteria group bacterium]|nr:CapA family protein [Patescibacteria group bacterium]MDD5715946.1 CapA family protein [Patescibacteria group bacterium]
MIVLLVALAITGGLLLYVNGAKQAATPVTTPTPDTFCQQHSADACPTACVVCPPCPECSSLGCHNAQYCEAIGFSREWSDSIQEQRQVVTLTAVGDIMLSRTVEQKMITYNDWAYPFRETYERTSATNITFGNLETPLIEGPIVKSGTMVFRADPKAVEGLELGGFDVLSLANNHIKNQGEKGITSTIETLDAAEILHVGAGTDIGDARNPARIERNGITFGFLACTEGWFNPASYEATEDRAGSPFCDESTIGDEVKRLKSDVDVVIVSMHAGTEYTLAPSDWQLRFAHAAIDNGAQLVIGHHPHVVEPIEHYKDGYILYSLGNFVFDQMWSEETREGAFATITFKGDAIIDVALTPVIIYDYNQPRIATGDDAERILGRMEDFYILTFL